MDILIPDEWLRDFLKTDASSKQIADCLSLAGPTVEKVTKGVRSDVYHIEITTNRIDSAGVYGIARETYAILPRFGFKASLISPVKNTKLNFTPKVGYLAASVDKKLCQRFTAVLIRNVKLGASPSWMKERLSWVGVRAINNVVDISNYIMHELGQPVHTFDYDKIRGAKMILREAKAGERITTLDDMVHELPGGDIVIEDATERLIDLAGIMGGQNSAVDASTRNVLLFVQTYNPVNIRKTSMALPKRTEAAMLFEKGLDPENVTLGIGRGIELFERLTKGKADKKILDIYPNPYKAKTIMAAKTYIDDRLGVDLPKSDIVDSLTPLGFSCKWKGGALEVAVPSYRARDVDLPEDIIEEVARIYGYHNFPSELMQGAIPDPLPDAPFDFEFKAKTLLKGLGGIEVYNSSLVPEEYVGRPALKLKNPLGKDSEYLRTSLGPSLVQSARENSGEKDPFHLFEMANVYIPKKGSLPEETNMLAGIFSDFSYRKAKGKIEALLNQLNIKADFEDTDIAKFLANRVVEIRAGGKALGIFGILKADDFIYYEVDMAKLKETYREFGSYKPIPRYPAQIEDITLIVPERTKTGDVLKQIVSFDSRVKNAELKTIYKGAYTFRIWYQDPNKTLKDAEVQKIRTRVLTSLKKKFGASLKD